MFQVGDKVRIIQPKNITFVKEAEKYVGTEGHIRYIVGINKGHIEPNYALLENIDEFLWPFDVLEIIDEKNVEETDLLDVFK